MCRILLIIFILTILPVQAFELDTSVDDEIQKQYNPSALEQSLPALPKTAPSNSKFSQNTPPKTLPVVDNSTKTKIGVGKFSYTPTDKKTAIRIKKGTKFKVKSNSYLADTTRIGANFNFTTLNPVYQTYITIPAGTVFSAIVTNSHAPQITGNGGLLEIAVTGAHVNGITYGAEGKVTKANQKKVFFNNIKGKRRYWKGVVTQVNKGQSFYKKTRSASAKLSENPITNLISPIPTIFGAGVYAVNLIGSPLFSIGTKGDKLTIPAGSIFEIKLLEDVYLERL